MSQTVKDLKTLTESSRTTAVERLFIRLRYEAKNLIAPYPSLYLPLARYSPVVRDEKRTVLVGDSTELTVEAFQGSGNTFAMGLFKAMTLNIAHHAHAPAQVIASVKRELPTLVIVREPEEAVLSFVVRHKVVTLSQALREYNNFHRHIYGWRDGFVVVRFENMTQDPTRVLERLDERFGTTFAQSSLQASRASEVKEVVADWHQAESASKVFEADVPLPSEVRSERKEWLRAELAQPTLQRLLARAQETYKTFSSLD